MMLDKLIDYILMNAPKKLFIEVTFNDNGEIIFKIIPKGELENANKHKK